MLELVWQLGGVLSLVAVPCGGRGSLMIRLNFPLGLGVLGFDLAVPLGVGGGIS